MGGNNSKDKSHSIKSLSCCPAFSFSFIFLGANLPPNNMILMIIINDNNDNDENDEDLTNKSHSINPTQLQLHITLIFNAVFECSKCYLSRWYFRKCSRYSKQGALKFEILEGACMPVANT